MTHPVLGPLHMSKEVLKKTWNLESKNPDQQTTIILRLASAAALCPSCDAAEHRAGQHCLVLFCISAHSAVSESCI